MKTSTTDTGCAEDNKHIIFTFAYIWIAVTLLKYHNSKWFDVGIRVFSIKKWKSSSHYFTILLSFIYWFSTFCSFISNFYKRFTTKCSKRFSHWYVFFVFPPAIFDRRKSITRFSVNAFEDDWLICCDLRWVCCGFCSFRGGIGKKLRFLYGIYSILIRVSFNKYQIAAPWHKPHPILESPTWIAERLLLF